MPRLPNFRNAIAAITMAVAALCGGGKAAVAEQKGTLSIMQIEVRDSAIENHLDSLANDIRYVLREAGRIRRGKPDVSGETVAIKIRDAEDFDRAQVALSDLADPRYFSIVGDRSSSQFVFTATGAFNDDVLHDALERAVGLIRARLFDPHVDLLVTPLSEDRVAVWRAASPDWQPGAHSLGFRTLQFYIVFDSFSRVEAPKSKKNPSTKVLDDAHDSKRVWLVDRNPLFRSHKILSVTARLEGSNPSLDIRTLLPKSIHTTIRGIRGTLAMVIDGKVFGTKDLDEHTSLRRISFPTGLSFAETAEIATEIDPISAQVKFVLLEECERSKPRSVRDMTC